MTPRETYFCEKPDHGWTGFCPCPWCQADELAKALVNIGQIPTSGKLRLRDVPEYAARKAAEYYTARARDLRRWNGP